MYFTAETFFFKKFKHFNNIRSIAMKCERIFISYNRLYDEFNDEIGIEYGLSAICSSLDKIQEYSVLTAFFYCSCCAIFIWFSRRTYAIFHRLISFITACMPICLISYCYDFSLSRVPSPFLTLSLSLFLSAPFTHRIQMA